MTVAIQVALRVWLDARDTQAWAAETCPDPDLIYRSGHAQQVADLGAFAHLLSVPVKVAGSHRSKSVVLPVGVFHVKDSAEHDAFIFTRNNFYDRKVTVVANRPVDLDYARVHTLMTQEQHDAVKQRAYAYQSRPPASDLSEFETDAWYTAWCGGTLIRDGDQIYTAESVASCYCEGIGDKLPKDVFVPYVHGASAFTIAAGTAAQQMVIMDAVIRSLRFPRRHQDDA